MFINIFLIAVFILILTAISDLIIGVSNDAANFLNSSLGSRVAPRYIILIVAGVGVLVGVTFSSGMMEVARKGIFHPDMFTMPNLMMIFVAVMFADILLLDLFNTYGLPTSTTVSVVFELLGASVMLSIIHIVETQGETLMDLGKYINTGRALVIIMGIILSIIVAFICGAIAQFITRIIFTFDYKKRLKRYGAIWGGIAMAFIIYFILIKGAKGASFLSKIQKEWIQGNAITIMSIIFGISAVIFQILLVIKINILKPIILIGTFSLALAFAANDLVNFIGVPLAGLEAYKHSIVNSAIDQTVKMSALAGKIHINTLYLLIAGMIMTITLWVSKKARTVSQTELNIGQQEEGVEKYESFMLSRVIVKIGMKVGNNLKKILPARVIKFLQNRFDSTVYYKETKVESRPPFDLLRASVNLMVASAVISYATAYKLPLSTTYITFMVSMGTSFSDRAWGRESAVYRIGGVLMVVGGWFFTAISAFTMAGIIALILFYSHFWAVLIMPILIMFWLIKTHLYHEEKSAIEQTEKIFNLKKINNPKEAILETFKQMGIFIEEIRTSLEDTVKGLSLYNENILRKEKRKIKVIQQWVNVIIANIFKVMRILHKTEHNINYIQYSQTIRLLQKLADGHRDIVLRSYYHVSNNHKGLLNVQINEINQIATLLFEFLNNVEHVFSERKHLELDYFIKKDKEIRSIIERFNKNQSTRILDGTSKTRLSILTYAILGNSLRIVKQNLKLLKIFAEAFSNIIDNEEFDME